MRPHGSDDVADLLVTVLQIAVAAVPEKCVVKVCIKLQVLLKRIRCSVGGWVLNSFPIPPPWPPRACALSGSMM